METNSAEIKPEIHNNNDELILLFFSHQKHGLTNFNLVMVFYLYFDIYSM